MTMKQLNDVTSQKLSQILYNGESFDGLFTKSNTKTQNTVVMTGLELKSCIEERQEELINLKTKMEKLNKCCDIIQSKAQMFITRQQQIIAKLKQNNQTK
ncbi:Hypothetical_protein [Hexamita inflata]|uniref:Hypothetical_protein n=1 Tax=Hexamita inflata TaxID=28002 RepID=A0AA86P692_9EUKA|nr:Hypothetical protein HINF_LOCUS20211 [Hexamita inflata]